ncbi:gamma-mobile-trio recombinase GmtY [Acinetobacter sp. WCHAc060025]|uniref:gamma-mobile-trio recombinase GmtY n=1 Tax=Acinetobacter sp. WCHAc060025 TaxID=2518625 RepID=UPI001023BF85|nr:gamma-mobile-trio recombinase GmtY [Acinetobacter sp. WCHAc060025]RZG72621.1 site-specific integrase [Acinetobacter sp. WCHAc060025]
MAYVKKIYVNYKDCSTQTTLVLPCILTEKGIIISHLRYLAWFNSKSEAWKERSCYALKLLLKYINATPNLDSATKVLKAFTEALITGTINSSNNTDPLELYWRPRSVRDTNNLLFHITHYTDFLVLQDDHVTNRVNPFRKATGYEERLNWCAYYHKQANVFLNHLTKKDISPQQVRVVGSFREDLIDFEYAVRFPEQHLERLLYLGFEKNEKIDYKSQAITMLMNYCGLRKSEIFHIFTSDITLNPNKPKEALVRVYHPELGASPDPYFKNRREYLLTKTSYKPRNNYLFSERLYAGWKEPLLTSKLGYFEVVFNPPEKAKEFLLIWANYLKYQRIEPSKSNPHPFAFTNTLGEPETIKNFQRLHKNAVERIGLVCKKALGTTEHGHRHAYGFRARQAGLNQVEIQKAMHHKSPTSCLVYIKPTLEEVQEKLREIQ